MGHILASFVANEVNHCISMSERGTMRGLIGLLGLRQQNWRDKRSLPRTTKLSQPNILGDQSNIVVSILLFLEKRKHTLVQEHGGLC
jgi:hypothetical protein